MIQITKGTPLDTKEVLAKRKAADKKKLDEMRFALKAFERTLPRPSKRSHSDIAELTRREKNIKAWHEHLPKYNRVPVKVLVFGGEVVVDWTTLTAFTKKLKGYQITMRERNGDLVISYHKRGRKKGSISGEFSMCPLGPEYAGLDDILPEASLYGEYTSEVR